MTNAEIRNTIDRAVADSVGMAMTKMGFQPLNESANDPSQQLQLREARRMCEKEELEESVRVFESLGLSRRGAEFAARGRGTI